MGESKKIKGSDLIAPDYLKDAIEQAEVFLKVIKETEKTIVATNKATSKKLKESAKGSTAKDLKDANALLNQSIKERELHAKAIEQEAKAELNLKKIKQAAADFDKKQLAQKEKEKKAIEQQTSAYAQASKKLNELRKQYKDLAIAGKSGEKASQEMLKTIQSLDKELKEVDASVGQFNRSVGDYKNQVKGAIAETELFTEGMSKLGAQQNQIIAGFTGIINQLKALKKGQDEANNSANKLGKTLKAIGIVALIAALASVFAFFTSSREGALQFDLMLNKIKATIDIMIGSFAKLGKGLIAFFQAAAIRFEILLLKMDVFDQSLKKKLELQRLQIELDKLSAESTENLTTAFDGNLDAIVAQAEEYDKLTREIFAYEDALKKLQIRLNDAKMDEEDFNEIQNDNTISLNKQKAALEGAIKARFEQAKISTEIADKEYGLAVKQAELELRKNKVSEEGITLLRAQGYEAFLNSEQTVKLSNEAIDALQEKFLAQKTAIDALEDLERQEAERRRQVIQTETINNIELIRSKKLGADEAVKILTKQVADEKFQLEERENFNNQLRQKQLEAQDEEIRLLGAFGLKKEEVYDLINEKDAVVLANKLKALRADRLSQEATDELAKIVFEAQTNSIAYNEQLEKFQDERIKREEKILQINREIAIINEQNVLTEVEKIEQEKQKILDKSNQEILEKNNVFNKKLVEQRRDAGDEINAIVEEEYKIKQSILAAQYEIDKTNIEKSVDDEKVRQKEIEKLTATFNSNTDKLIAEKEGKKKDFLETELALLKAIEIKKTEIIVEYLQKATDALASELDKRDALRTDKMAKEIEKTNLAIEKQRDLATRGLANTLAFQEAQLEKQLLAQKDLERKAANQKENIALAEALLNAYNAELKQPNADPMTAGAKALADVLLFKGLAAGLVQFAAEGNDDVQGPGTTTSDSIPFMLSKHEGVVKAAANMDNPGVVAALNNDTFDQLYMPKYRLLDTDSTAHNIANSLVLQSNKEVINLLTEIKNKPVQGVDVDKLGNLIETIYENGKKTVIKHKIRPRL
jgi:hypothetical protein